MHFHAYISLQPCLDRVKQGCAPAVMPHRRHAIVAVPCTHLLWYCCAAISAAAGHAFLGLHLAKKLLSDGHKVTILNDGDEAKLSAKAPFSQYASLDGAQVVWGSPADPSSYPEGSFDVVYDNNGKKMDDCQPLIDHFKVWITACSWRWQLSRISHTRSHCAFLTAALQLKPAACHLGC